MFALRFNSAAWTGPIPGDGYTTSTKRCWTVRLRYIYKRFIFFKCRPYYIVEWKRRIYLVQRLGRYSDKNENYYVLYCVLAFSNASRTSTVPIKSTYESTGLAYLKRAAVVQARNVCSERVEPTPTGDLVQGLKKKISIIHFFETHPCTLRAFILPPPPPHTHRPPHRHAQRSE